MRLLCYNVRSLRDDTTAVASVVRACRPDVVCVQEAPRFLRWRSKRAALARRCGLVVLTAQRPGGLMVMGALRVTPVTTDHVLLSKQPRLHQRAVDVAVVDVDGARWTLASTHFSLDPAERRRHVDEVFAVLDRHDAPVVLAGDINETPGEPAWSALGERLQDAYAVAPRGPGETYSSRHPHKRIDGVFVDRSLEVVSCEVPRPPGVEAASDHLPVLVELRPR